MYVPVLRRVFPALVLIFALFFPLRAGAQYLLTAVSPPPQFSHDDLWNLSITRSNIADGYTQFYIALRIFNQNNQLEVKTNSANISLTNTVTVINLGNISTVQPFTMNYYNGTLLQQVIASGGLFPSGTYNIDFTLFGRPTDGTFTELGNYSYQTIVDALWPPMLLSPEDEDTLDTQMPIFTWTPAFSSAYTGTITYSLLLVEVMSGQTKEQAIMSNEKMYAKSGLISTFDVYDGFPLPNSNKRYAWMVTANAGLQTLNSQVWAFVLATNPAFNNLPSNYFARLSPDPGSFVYKANNMKLHILYDEEYVLPTGYTNLNYKIYDHTGRVVASSFSASPLNYPIIKGTNYISLDCQALGLQSSGISYLLEVQNLKGEKGYLRFKPATVTQPDNPNPEN